MSSPSDRGRRQSTDPSLFDPKERLTRTDLWAWEDAAERIERAEAPRPGRGSGFEGIVAAMRDPSLYPGSPEVVEVRETHISWVFLAGDRAYKLKKPIVFPFLDYATAERRREMCELEVELNRRLAGDLYLGVKALVDRGGRLRLAPSGAGAIEHVVEMRRFDEADTLAARVVRGQARTADVAAVGRRLASFHADAGACGGGENPLAAVNQVAEGNFAALLASGAPVDPRRVLAAQRFVDSYLSGHADLVTSRAAAGLVRECHGDLRAEHVLLGEEVRVVDCAEFDAALRHVDVGADLAFLVMDLARLRRPDLGRALVDAYRDAGGDPGPDHLIAFHAAIKAWVRAKVTLLRASDAAGTFERRAAARAEVAELFALGERLAWQARLPLTVIVCGAPATGKSSLARRLSEASGLAVIASDETRKRMAGLEPTQRAPEDLYTPAASERTYAELGRQAAEQVDDTRGAIVDATFGRSADRHAFAAAFAAPTAPVFFECRAPAEVIRARARAREQDPGRVSDAGTEIAARMGARFEPLEDDVQAARHIMLRTDQPVEDAVEDAVAMLDRHLALAAGPMSISAST